MGAMETKTFDFIQYAAGTNYPTDTVNIYTNADAAYQINKLEKELSRTIDATKVSKLERAINKLKREMKASKVTITMRAIPLRVENKFNKEADEIFGKDENAPGKAEWLENAFIAAHIVSVENAKGEVDESPWDSEKINTLFNVLTIEGVARIKQKTQELSLRSDLFENVEVNPDF